MTLLEIRNLGVSVEDTAIIRDLSLNIEADTLTVIMGKNGTGKSSMAYALMGHPAYEVTNGTARFDGEDLLDDLLPLD